MKIVFYNTSSKDVTSRSSAMFYPKRADIWDDLADHYPEHEFYFVTSNGGGILLDITNGEISVYPKKVKYVITNSRDSADEIADIIISLNPDAAIEISTANTPIDWNFIKDSLVAEKLREKGIRTISHTLFSSLAFYDKWRSSMALRNYGFNVAESVFVHNDQYWAEREIKNMTNNVYKEYILYKISRLNYPVIIKGTIGAGSTGIEIAQSFEEAKAVLNSENNNADLIVEEMIQGENIGTDIFGADGQYHVPSAYFNSTTDKNISDPYHQIKFGPITAERYNLKEMQESLIKLANDFKFGAGANVDLIFKDGKWYIIEVNPRWSGMTTTAAAAEGRNPLVIYAESVFGSSSKYSDVENLKYTLNFKIPEIDEETFNRLSECDCVKSMLHSMTRLPDRIIQYCEIIIGGFETPDDLIAGLKKINDDFPGVVSEDVMKTAVSMAENNK